MKEIEEIIDEINRLRVEGLELQGKKAQAQKAVAIDETIAKQETNLADIEKGLSEAKDSLKIAEKAMLDSITASVDQMKAAMSEMLPGEYEPYISVEDGMVNVGLTISGKERPAAGLSGGERSAFLAALEYAMIPKTDNRLVIVEAGEMDDTRLGSFLATCVEKHSKAQVIVNTWHLGDTDDEWEHFKAFNDWTVFDLGEQYEKEIQKEDTAEAEIQ